MRTSLAVPSLYFVRYEFLQLESGSSLQLKKERNILPGDGLRKKQEFGIVHSVMETDPLPRPVMFAGEGVSWPEFQANDHPSRIPS